MRQYGTLTIDRGRSGPPWLTFVVEPQVAMRLRRVFAGVQGAPGEPLQLKGTPAILVDVAWFCDRYPLEVRGVGRDGVRWLQREAAAERTRGEEVLHVMDGTLAPREIRLALPPREYQAQAAEVVLRTNRLLVADEVGLGKAQPLDARVLTPDGWRRIGDLVVGDIVTDPDGGCATVQGVYDRGRRMVYRLTTSDGAATECCGEHLWTVQTGNDRTRGTTRTLTTARLRAQGLRQKKGPNWVSRFFLPIMVPRETPSPGRPTVAPYLLGVLLGDGCLKKRAVSLSTSDPELLGRVRTLLPAGVQARFSGGVDYRLACGPQGSRPNPLMQALRSLGLAGHRSYEKRIPPRAFGWSVADRLDLLRGLMDTDGTCAADGGAATFTTTSPGLADDIGELIGSLGGFASRWSRITEYTYQWVRRAGRRSYTLNVRMPDCPFWISRKACRWHRPTMARAIRSIVPVGRRQTRCIAVDSARNLYVTDGYIVTHNTITSLCVVAAVDARPALVVVPPHLAPQWEAETRKFLPGLRTHIVRTRAVYPVQADLLICSYHRLAGWADFLAGKIRAVIFDEAQELRRRGTDKYEACRAVAARAAFRLGLSATPIFNYGAEFHNVFEVLAPGELGTRTEFLDEWCAQAEGMAQKEPRLRDPHAFGAFLREHGLMVRRTRAQVRRELPAVTHVLETVDCDAVELDRVEPEAVRLARIIYERRGTPLDRLRAAQELSALSRAATGIAKAPHVAAFVRMLVEDSGEKVVLFGWHRAVYDCWAGLLADLKPAWHTGTESPMKKRAELARFLTGDARVLMMSLRSGAGVDGLQRATARVVFGELDWSPAAMEQCAGRVHRDGQTEPVLVYYLLAQDGADPVMMDVLGLKRMQLTGVREQFAAEELPAEADPDHVRKLAAAYLARAGVLPAAAEG